ncbi:hypothetical protein K457DRAFT_90222 [Linnemannia elongata AG-77]|uniref:SNARE-complex protein Syntaxin-18 N-terminal domain-containing protein n=1 Tax=Linnemannia elongata AG-77 TaxID=1314771 RepID=A0A197K687_9FUNG|nr:hypothetical protein K457DRAFT_90222 [Linnemannia elongata AG-77]
MPDLTSVFRATVQDLSQASGNMSGIRSPNPATTRTTKSTPDPWLKEAHQISRTMADLRAFIIATRPAYLNLSRGSGTGSLTSSRMGAPRRSDSIPSNNGGHRGVAGSTSSKVLQELLDTVASLTSLSDKDRDSIDTQVKVMMRQIKGAIEELESLEQERRKKQRANAAIGGGGFNQLLAAAASTMGASGPVDQLAQHRQGVTLYLNERLASLATLHKDQYEVRIAREMEKRESSLYKALPKPTQGGANGYGMTQRRNFNDTTSTATPPLSVPGSPFTAAGGPGFNGVGGNRSDPSKGASSSHDYYSRQGGGPADDQDFEQGLTAQERQMLEMENENIVRKLETELNQVRQLETSMIELSTLHSTIQEHLEIQTQQTNRLHEEAQTAINHIDAGNEQLIKAGKRNNSTRKWILFFLILASFVLLFLDWYD